MAPSRPLLLILAIAAAAGLSGCKPPNISITETPIRVQSRTPGSGPPVEAGDTVRVEYVIALPGDRRVLDQKDFQFVVGRNAVIRGVDEAVLGMQSGSEILFVCPPHKHWGRAGYGNGLIPPATDLTIRLRLLEVVSRAPRKSRGVTTTSEVEEKVVNPRWRAVSEAMGSEPPEPDDQ